MHESLSRVDQCRNLYLAITHDYYSHYNVIWAQKTVILYWILHQISIFGNEATDEAVWPVLNFPITGIGIPQEDDKNMYPYCGRKLVEQSLITESKLLISMTS